MLPTDFPQSNMIFNKPVDMTDEQCMSLPVWKGNAHDETGVETPVIISCWKLSYEDLQEIQKTGCVWLSITGYGMPPVSVFAETPWPTF